MNVEMTLTVEGSRLLCTVREVKRETRVQVTQAVHKWVKSHSCGRDVDVVTWHFKGEKGEFLFGDHLVGECRWPLLAEMFDGLTFFSGLGYYELDQSLREADREDVRKLLVFNQVHGGKTWRPVVVNLSVGGCDNCRFSTTDGCLIGEDEEKCLAWMPSQRSSGPESSHQ